MLHEPFFVCFGSASPFGLALLNSNARLELRAIVRQYSSEGKHPPSEVSDIGCTHLDIHCIDMDGRTTSGLSAPPLSAGMIHSASGTMHGVR